MGIFNNRNREYDIIHTNKKKERKKMVIPEFNYNDLTGRWDIEFPYELGDLKDMVCVASVDLEYNTITFWKTISINDLSSMLPRWEKFKTRVIDKNPMLAHNDPKPEPRFELDPDGNGDKNGQKQ